MLETFRRDVRHAVRLLAGSPTTSLAVILSLGLGIGANIAVFSAVNAVFLRGLPVEEPHRLVRIFTEEERQYFRPYIGISRANYLDLRRRSRSFDALAQDLVIDAHLRSAQEEAMLPGRLVSRTYFEILGVDAAQGELFRREPLAEFEGPPLPETILSFSAWTRYFDADPAVVGQTIQLNQRPFEVVGVTPEGFVGTDVLALNEIWVPIETYDIFLRGERRMSFGHRRALFSGAIARLAPGVSLEEASQELERLGAQLAEEYPEDNNGRSFHLLSFDRLTVDANQRAGLLQTGRLFFAITAFILLIACANVANLLLGRALGRRRELALRMALGATRIQVLRQLITESLVLALCGGAVGLMVASLTRKVLWSLRPPQLEASRLDLSFDLQVLAFAFLMTLFASVVFGFAPALRALRVGLGEEIRRSEVGAEGGNRRVSVWNLLILLQVALVLVASVGSGLFLRSLAESLRLDPGFEPGRLLLMDVDPGKTGYDVAQREEAFNRALEATSGVEGVETVSLTRSFPLSTTILGLRRTVFVEDRDPEAANNGILIPLLTVEPNYFDLLGLEATEGRVLSADDDGDAEYVAVVNQAMADLFWEDGEVLGERFHFHGQEEMRRVIGVVPTTPYLFLTEPPRPQVYLPRKQDFASRMSMIVRYEAEAEPNALMDRVEEAIRAVEPDLPTANRRSAAEALSGALWPARISAILLLILAALAAIMAGTGIYSVTAYDVGRRRHELAVRMALGASPEEVSRMVVFQTLRIVLIGLALGLGITALLAGTIKDLLYGVRPLDPATLGAASAAIFLLAAAACYLPARRVVEADPMTTLRD